MEDDFSSIITGSTSASGALTRFVDLDRRFPDRFLGNIDSGTSGDDFSYTGYDTVTGLVVTAFASADGGSNFTGSYDPNDSNSPSIDLSTIDFSSMMYMNMVPFPPGLLSPPSEFEAQPYLVPPDGFTPDLTVAFNSEFGFFTFEPQSLFSEGFDSGSDFNFDFGFSFGFSFGSNFGSDFSFDFGSSFSFSFDFSGIFGGGSDARFSSDEVYYTFEEAIY